MEPRDQKARLTNVSAYVARLQAALAQRLRATNIGEKHEAEQVIAEILRGKPEREQFDAKQAQAGKDE